MSTKSLFVLIFFLAAIFIGAYFVLKPKPAFDVAALRSTIEAGGEKMKSLARMADTDNLPSWLQKKVTYYEDQFQILQENQDDCDTVVVELAERHREFLEEMQSIDQQGVMAEMLKGGRQQQARLAATIYVVSKDWALQLLPMIEDFCDSCPEESDIFNRVLSF